MRIARLRKFGGQSPLGLLGMLLCIVLIERFVARHEADHFLKMDSWTWNQTAKRAVREARDAGLICLGDSLVQVGIAPILIEARTGLVTNNLALSGGQPASSYFLLRRVLEAGGEPKAVLIDFFPKHLQVSPTVSLDPWTSIAQSRELFDLARQSGDTDFLGRALWSRWVPSSRARPEVRNAILAALREENRRDRQHVPPYWRRNLQVNQGGVLCPPPEEAQTTDLVGWTKRYFPADWECDPVNERYIRRLLRLAESRKIQVYWLLPPMQPALQSRVAQNGLDAKYVAFVQRIRADFPGLTVIDGRHANYDPAVFFDPHHLARTGAAVLSHDIALILHERLSQSTPPRNNWVSLPGYGPRRIGEPLEDVNQSRTLLRLSRTRTDSLSR